MNGTTASVAVGAGAQQQQVIPSSSPVGRGKSVAAAVSPTRRQEPPTSDGNASSSDQAEVHRPAASDGSASAASPAAADMSCADTGFGPAHTRASVSAPTSRCVASDTALAASTTAIELDIDTRASTPTPPCSLPSGDGCGDSDEHDAAASSCASSPSASPSSSRSGSHLSDAASDAASAASTALVDATSLQFDTAMIEQIAARAAAAAAAAVFGATAASVQQQEEDALAEEVASLGSSDSLGEAGETTTTNNNNNNNNNNVGTGITTTGTTAGTNMRAYSVQSLEQYSQRSGSCASVGSSRTVQQESITSPSITFPLPIFGSRGTTTTCAVGGSGQSGKKRRLPTSDAAVAASLASSAAENEEAAAMKNIASSKKKALFYPTKKKRKAQPSTSVVSTSAGTAKPRALVVQKATPPSARATTPVPSSRNPNAKPPKGRIEIRTVPPTIKGIHEAARVLLSSTTVNPLAYPISPTSAPASDTSTAPTDTPRGVDTNEGILSFPTETVYTLTTCITVKPLLRSSSTSSTSSTSASEDDPDGSTGGMNGRYSSSTSSVHSPSLTRLLRLKGRLPTSSTAPSASHTKAHTEDDVHSSQPPPPPVALCADADPALLYIHTPTQSREFVHFTKPKTFVLKPSSESSMDAKKGSAKASAQSTASGSGRLSPKSAQQSPAQVPAVTFSESREVLDRLTNAFWPGPVIIYAKCKMRKTLRERHLPSIQEESSLSPLKMPAPIERQSSEEDEVVYAPILPTSILHPYINTDSGDVDLSDAQHDNNGSFYYVGMRCPSHPLARRALEEVYSRNRQRQQHQAAAGGSGGSSGGGRRVRSRVVVGFNAKSATWTDCPISAKEVSSQLNGDTINLCPHEAEGTTSFIDVLNGEDEQEMFMAPTCQFGKGACISLVVDDDTKTIHIVHPTSASKSEAEVPTNTNKKSKISSRDIVRALRTSPRASIEIGNSYEDVAADAEKVASRVISVVLNRWKCVEHKH